MVTDNQQANSPNSRLDASAGSALTSVPLLTRLSVFLITLSGLVLEVGLTRIYSASIWYHFTFVAISVALLGWGLGGFIVHVSKKFIRISMDAAALVTLLYAAAIPLCLWLLASFPYTEARLPLYFLAPVVPFFLAGMALSIVFDVYRASASSLYFYDLVGAALGAVLVVFLLHLLGGEAALLAAAIGPAIAAVCLSFAGESDVSVAANELSTDSRRRIWPRAIRLAGMAAVVLTAFGVYSTIKFGTFRVVPSTVKAMRREMDKHPEARIKQTGWNAYSRIDAVEGIPYDKHLARLYIDSDAWTNIYGWDGRLESADGLRRSYRALPFRFTPNGETLVIGPGGGADVVSALSSGSRKVTAVELNPLMLKFVRSYGERAGNLYDRPDVEAIESEGRSFISRTNRKFDTIFLGFVDSWASVASGGLSLSENHLYTTEAFQAYYEHLNDNGVLVILRWRADVERLVANWVSILGPEAARQRIAVLMESRTEDPDNPGQMLFMLRKRAFTAAETAEIANTWTDAAPLILPGGPAPPPVADLLAGRKTLADYEAASDHFVGPVSDDSPFYFAVERPFRMPATVTVPLLKWLLGPSVVLLVVFAIFGRPRRGNVGPYTGSLVYFAALGFGFIAIELALLQNLTLLVGHPIYTLSVLLFTLLLTGGIGSKWLGPRVSMRMACLGVAAIGALEAIVLPRLVPLLLPVPLLGRIFLAGLFILPLGLAMGIPFPRGLKETDRGSLPAPPFYWGLNGIMSVLGSVATVFVALMVGFQAAMLMGSACYVLAALASRRAFQQSPT